jgi:type I restriction enzyme S subunit
MIWHEIQLGDAIHVKHGFAFKGQHFSDAGEHIVLTPGNFNEQGGFRLRPGKDRFYIGDIPEDYILAQGDLIIAMTEQGPGLLGSPALVPEGGKYLHNQRLGLVQILDDSLLDKRFLYHLFNTRAVRGQISGSASGTKVRHTAPERIYRVKASVPTDVAEQTRIGSILSAYDDLIENNRRRIQLLEQSARLLYKEWFVRLRFPGREHVKVKDGVPEGWKRKTLGDVVDVTKGKNITKDSAKDGTVPVVAGGLSPAYYHDTANAVGPVITVSASGANAGYVNLYHENIWASDCSYISRTSTEHLYYFYLLLTSKQKEVFAFQKGAAQPHVYPKDLKRLPLLNPTETVVRLFEESISHNFLQVRALLEQNKLLAQARDLLLQRLMNGEIEI